MDNPEFSPPSRDPAADRLSSLPNDLLRRILSSLEFRDLMTTPLISPRYRNLWTSVPSLTINSPTPGIINNVLRLFTADSLHSLRISFDQPHIPHIPSWVQFAARQNTKHLDLSLHTCRSFHDDHLPTVHPSLYGCPSLEFLKLRMFNLNLCAPSTPMDLPALKVLRFELMNVAEEVFVLIFSGCPNLEDLCLMECNASSSIKIDASGHRKLKNLEICDKKGPFIVFYEIEVDAPSLLSLRIESSVRGRACRVKDNMMSLVAASLDFRVKYITLVRELYYEVMEMLDAVSHVKSLKLSSWCIQVLSTQGENDVQPLFYNATKLELETGLRKADLFGMAYLLNSFPQLEELVLNFSPKDVCYAYGNHKWRCFAKSRIWELLDICVPCLNQVKTIEINGFMGSKALTDKEDTASNDEFIDRRKSELHLAEVLLGKCPLLDKMVVRTVKLEYPMEKLLSLQLNISGRLQTLRRASSTAVIALT